LILEDGGQVSVLFRGNPDVAVRPEGEGAQFLDGRMCVGDAVADGEGRRVEDADVATQTVKDAGCFEGHEFGVGANECQ
jgi:hypothetical protein